MDPDEKHESEPEEGSEIVERPITNVMSLTSALALGARLTASFGIHVTDAERDPAAETAFQDTEKNLKELGKPVSEKTVETLVARAFFECLAKLRAEQIEEALGASPKLNEEIREIFCECAMQNVNSDLMPQVWDTSSLKAFTSALTDSSQYVSDLILVRVLFVLKIQDQRIKEEAEGGALSSFNLLIEYLEPDSSS
ncbi:hypothetical protein OAO01_08930 [Oligoflexia bacterium]|nr:hypothetical protein [Oligoflexia bacterium]